MYVRWNTGKKRKGELLMKKKLYFYFKRMFIKEWVEEKSDIIAPYLDREYEAKAQIRELEKFKRQDELIERIFSEYSTSKIIGLKEDKKGNQFFVVDAMDTIYLYSWNSIGNKPRMYYEIHQNSEGENVMEIVDVLMSSINEGQGTIAMEGLLKIAKERNVAKIWGKMAPCDDDHAERRAHYYEKFGFTISGRTATLIMEA